MSRPHYAQLIAFWLLAIGCHVQPPAVRGYPPPTSGELFSALKRREAQVRSLRADTKVEQRLGPKGQSGKVRVSMLVARGGKLRFEAESPLGGVVATLVANGSDFQLLDTRANRLLTGPAKACNLARLLKVELEPEEVVAVLFGGAPFYGEPSSVAWDPSRGGREVLTLTSADGGRETLWLDAHDRVWDLVEGERRDGQGTLRWRFRHEGFEDQGGVRFPSRTTVEEPPHHAEAQVRFRSVEVNPALDEHLFHLEAPGLQPEYVGCN